MATKKPKKTTRTSRRKQQPSYTEYMLQQRKEQIRSCRKVVFFSEQESAMIDRYCQKYKVKSKSAFFREVILTHLLEDLDANYPKLF